MKSLLLVGASVLAVAAFLLAGTARSRAERRAIAYAAGLGFAPASAACTTEDLLHPGYLLCYVEERGEPRGASVFCSTGLLGGGCQKMPTNGEPLLPSNDS
jgi:hypothetical protein